MMIVCVPSASIRYRCRTSSGAAETASAPYKAADLKRAQFGRRSERIDGDQLALGLEDVDADIARLQECHPAASANDVGSPPASHRQGLPDHPRRCGDRY
jgi:Transposase C of IS166 homeodomain